MVFPIAFHPHYIEYFLQRDVTKLYISIAIRNFALGMVGVFEAIYVYMYFKESVPAILFYYGVMFGLYGLLVPFGGKIIEKIGAKKSILASYVFYIGYYASLFFLDIHASIVVLAIMAGAVGMVLFWPAFHTDFIRFSSKKNRGKESGRVNVAMLVPVILAPALGGVIISSFGFSVLFLVVGVVLFASATPLFSSKEHIETYTDSYAAAWRRVFKKQNWNTSIGLFSQGVEFGIHIYAWPLFLFTMAIGFFQIGGISSFALIAATFFMLYAGKLSDTEDRSWLLTVGSFWTAIAWILKYFVTTPFSALLAHSTYRVSRASARIPFWTFFYEKAADKGEDADEFVIYHEIVVNIGRGAVFIVLAGIFFVFPDLPLKVIFLFAAFLALGFSFVGNPPKIPFIHT